MYKKALNSFFLKVHPDFFQYNREHQVANETAVAQLNELLTWAKEFKAGMLRPPPATSITFTFYRRPDDDDVGNETPTGASSSFAVRGFPPAHNAASDGSMPISGAVTSTFQLPEDFTASEANRGLAERAVNRFLRDLLRRADCIDSVAESMSAAEDAAASRMEAKPLRRRPTPNLRRRPNPKAKSLLDEASETMTMQWTLTTSPTLEELMEADHILFSKALSPLECTTAMQTLRANMGELRYGSWESMPLILSDHFAIGEVSGSLTIPWDFTPVQFLSFLAHNDTAVQSCRRAALGFATDIESLLTELCQWLDCDDVLISCSHKEAIHTLRLLHRHKDLLYEYGVTGITLEVERNRCATRANGVVIISAEIKTLTALRSWLEAVAPKMHLQRKLYKVSKHMLETTMWHLKEFRAMAEPAGLDAFDNNDYTYAQRLAWAKELFRIGASLAQWDWSEFTFILSPELDLNWESRSMALPADFDGDALLRYVEEIQREATQRKRSELLQRSSTARDAEAAAHERARRHELAISAETEGQSVAKGGDTGRVLPIDPTDPLRDLYRRTSPHMEEYLVSSSDAVDNLSVERPLSHAVTFASDDEVGDQLKWEGFYQEPYVDQVAPGDLDDMAHTYMATNRWHREEAAKKLLEDLRGTYGPKSRRFDYQKMGDLLEINNARVQPKGFPTITRGLRPGSS